MRAFRDGDLIQESDGCWLVLSKEGAELAKAYGDGKDILLVAADVELWTALRGLTKNGIKGDWYLYIPLSPDYDMHISTPESNFSHMPFIRGPVDCNESRLPNLKQAVQRFEAVLQYIKSKGNKIFRKI